MKIRVVIEGEPLVKTASWVVLWNCYVEVPSDRAAEIIKAVKIAVDKKTAVKDAKPNEDQAAM